MDTTVAIDTREFRIPTPQGRLYAKSWSAGGDQGNDRAPIVLFHDSLGSVALWRDFPERLARATGRTVIAYDRLGYGQSDTHPGKLGLRFVHDEARVGFPAVREQLGIDEFILFGHSIGGGMAIACAAAWPEACRALVVESSQLFVEQHTLDGIRDAEAFFARPGQLERLEKYHGDKAAWALQAWIGTWFDPGFADWNLDAELQQVQCPLLAIYGDADEYGTLAHPARIERRLQTSMMLQVMEGCGHFPHRERGAMVADVTARWLEGVTAG
ncbi:MAG TPA: alpha/beta hydrolase [Gammaproteobacteria bacterium]|nr:alpha/beta hydrolase [Luteimonas sp.]HRO26518.1 alpha/beta hydrolase [Luteimonas sp.]HRP35072.1 alpha/beta hydrolase [Gammaproteobacteria bacterium]HRP73641.1 alpha/beta hydrolase [Luteimonas sp.]